MGGRDPQPGSHRKTLWAVAQDSEKESWEAGPWRQQRGAEVWVWWAMMGDRGVGLKDRKGKGALILS